MLVDANILLFAVDRESRFNASAAQWLSDALNGVSRVGLPWESLTAFLRISTNPRAVRSPLSPVEAWSYVSDWLSCEVAWTPGPTQSHAAVMKDLIERYELRGNLISDGHLAALAIEHGIAVYSADTDFARFGEIRWINPVASQ